MTIFNEIHKICTICLTRSEGNFSVYNEITFFRKKTATHLILLFHRNSFSTVNNLLNKMIIYNFYVCNKVTFVFSDKKSEDCKVEKLHSTDERINHFNDYYRPFELTALKHHYTMIMEHSVRY